MFLLDMSTFYRIVKNEILHYIQLQGTLLTVSMLPRYLKLLNYI
jgi:hypothetical protein